VAKKYEPFNKLAAQSFVLFKTLLEGVHAQGDGLVGLLQVCETTVHRAAKSYVLSTQQIRKTDIIGCDVFAMENNPSQIFSDAI
jgi:hypothetical protein